MFGVFRVPENYGHILGKTREVFYLVRHRELVSMVILRREIRICPLYGHKFFFLKIRVFDPQSARFLLEKILIKYFAKINISVAE